MNGLGSLKTRCSCTNCYPCHRTVPVWSMAQQSAFAVSYCIQARRLPPALIILLVMLRASENSSIFHWISPPSEPQLSGQSELFIQSWFNPLSIHGYNIDICRKTVALR